MWPVNKLHKSEAVLMFKLYILIRYSTVDHNAILYTKCGLTESRKISRNQQEDYRISVGRLQEININNTVKS